MAVTNMFPAGGGAGAGGSNIYGPYSLDSSGSDTYTITFVIPSADTILMPKIIIGYEGSTNSGEMLFAKMNDFDNPSSGYTAYRCSFYSSTAKYYEQVGVHSYSYTGGTSIMFFLDEYVNGHGRIGGPSMTFYIVC